MNITVSIEFDKDSIKNFNELENTCYDFGLQTAREMMRRALEIADTQILVSRDAERYRSKGFQQTCIKTKAGVVEYKRRVYEDKTVTEGLHCVHLLDEVLGINPVGMVSPGMCEQIATHICESTYRATAQQITDLSGLSISAQGVWNIVQKMGTDQRALIEREAELAEAHQGLGQISTKILFEENDGIFLKMQGDSRKKNGASKEMKVGIAYDGATYEKDSKGKVTRRTLDNKVAFAGFEKSKDFKKLKEGVIANRYNVDEIELRVVNGDGAGWVQGFGTAADSIVVLDEFHRNHKMTSCVMNKDFLKILQKLLNDGKYDQVMECIEAQINSIEDNREKELLKELLTYYENNREALPGYYERGIAIPETREPGVIHHARLGSMESNIFTLAGNRMKGKRKSWSISGANNLAVILTSYHTTGLKNLFREMPAPPVVIPELTEEEEAFINAPIPSKRDYADGKGYEHPENVSTTNLPYFLRNLSHFKSFTELSI